MNRLLVPLLLMFVGTAHAELRKLTEADFGTDTVDLAPNLPFGADASCVWSQYGVFLSSHPTGSPIIGSWIPPCVICVQPAPHP